jgi:hypothetical protein
LVGRHGFLLITCFAKQLYPVLPVDQPIHLLNCLVARSDLFFFFEMTTVSVLMLLHLGMLSGARKTIDYLFEEKPNDNTQPQKQH